MTEQTMDSNLESVPAPARRILGPGSILLLVGIVVIAIVFGLALARQNQTQPTSGPAPDFTMTTLDGAQIHLADLKGKVVVVNFWASWCGPCRDEAQALQTVWQKYQDQGVVMVGIAYTDTERNARAFLTQYGQTYPNGLDIGTKISEMYNIQGVPETFIIDREGKVVKFYMEPFADNPRTGVTGVQMLSRAIDEVLGSET